MSSTLDPSQVQSIWWFAHSTGSPRFKPLCVAGCHWRFGLWDCIGMCSRSIVFEVVIDTIIRGLFFPHFLVSRNCRRLLALFVTLARSHVFRIGFSTRTVCCGDRGASPFAVRSWYYLNTSCRCWRNAFTSPFDRGDTTGRFDLYFLPFRISHGDGRLWSTGVVLRHTIAK